MHRTCPVRGELDGVAEQVDHHPFDESRIRAQHETGPGHVDDQLDVLGDHGLQRGAQAFEERAEVDELEPHLDLARLGPCDVEQVVDERQQRRARVADQLDLMALLAGQPVRPRVQEQPGKTEDRVERGAQLVADARPEPGLALTRRTQLPGRLVQLRVQGDDTLVGLLQLVGQLRVQRQHPAVGLLQLGVGPHEVVLARLQVFQRGQQVLVLDPQGLQRAPGRCRPALPAQRVDALRGQRFGAAAESSGQHGLTSARPHRHLAAVHEPRGRGEPFGALQVDPGAGDRPRRGDHQAGRATTRHAQGDGGGLSDARQLPAQLAQRRGHPDLVLVVEPDDRSDGPAPLPGGEHVRLAGDAQPDELVRRGRHDAALPTNTQASSCRIPASRSRVAASSSGARPTRPRTSASDHRARTPSECITTTAPGG